MVFSGKYKKEYNDIFNKVVEFFNERPAYYAGIEPNDLKLLLTLTNDRSAKQSFIAGWYITMFTKIERKISDISNTIDEIAAVDTQPVEWRNEEMDAIISANRYLIKKANQIKVGLASYGNAPQSQRVVKIINQFFKKLNQRFS